jgi:L-alanine-DL-glutamate epimerase-like enolase superfamily enzyme
MLSRRKLISGLGAAAAAAEALFEGSSIARAAPKAATELGKVKIRDVRTASVQLSYYPGHLVKIVTDSGLYGLGEAHNGDSIIRHIESIKHVVIGEDPLQVDYLFQKMIDARMYEDSRAGTLTGAISGIETALWDLAGKILNVPVYVLLGGKFRDKLLIYHDTGDPKSPEPKAWAEEAQRSRALGFRAMKFDLERYRGESWNRSIASEDIRQWVAVLRAIRKELGPDFPLGVDLHWKCNTRDALRFIQEVEDLNLWFVEDPLLPENVDAFARLTAASRVPILTGELLHGRQSFRPYLEKQACDIIQPDPQNCGGLLETKKIADMADLYYIPTACHNMCSPLGTIATGHACLAMRSFLTLESDSVEVPHWHDIIRHSGPLYRDGYLEVPEGPGLGVELDEAVCRKHLASGSSFF